MTWPILTTALTYTGRAMGIAIVVVFGLGLLANAVEFCRGKRSGRMAGSGTMSPPPVVLSSLHSATNSDGDQQSVG